MSDKWVVDPEHPEGYLVPMTADEEAQLVVDRAAAATFDAAARAARQARRALRAKLAAGTATTAEVQTLLADILGDQ